MPFTPAPSPEIALARWLAHGVTSLTHPILQCALQDHFHPLGIEAEALECEPFSALESGRGEWWLRRPRWNPQRFDRAHPAEADFRFLLAAPERFTVDVDSRGRLCIRLDPSSGDEIAADSFRQDADEGWRAARHAVEAAEQAEAFIFAAAGLLLANDPASAIYAAGDDAAFGAAVRRRLAGASLA